MKWQRNLINIFAILSLSLWGLVAIAQENETDALSTAEKPPLVEVQIQQDILAVYKERRETHGVYFGLSYEAFDLKNFISMLDGKTYEELFGSTPIPLVGIDIEYKYNFALGSVALGVQYAKGNLSNDQSGTDRTLDIYKYGAGIKFTADMLFDEPYVAPYVGLNAWRMGFSEENAAGESFSEETEIGYNYTVGILVQLDWLDYQAAKGATLGWGLENTFIDLYATQYAKTDSDTDVDTETDLLYGAGLRLEF